MIWLAIIVPLTAIFLGVMLIFLHGAAILRDEEERAMCIARAQNNEDQRAEKARAELS